MKKTLFLFSALAFTTMALAKDKTIVIKGNSGIEKGNTEVILHESEDSDTLTVTPGTGVTTITVTVRDLDGVLLQQDVLSATGDYLNVSTPPTSNGCILTLRDDNGVVYTEYDD